MHVSGCMCSQLQFEKGDMIQVTRMVDGGWWEGVQDGRCGWFPGNYVEKVTGKQQQCDSVSLLCILYLYGVLHSACFT